MKDVERIIDSIVRDVPIDRRGIWTQVFAEQIVGKKKVQMSALDALKEDECFKRLESEGFFRIEKERSHASELGIVTGNPSLIPVIDAKQTFVIPNDSWCKLLLVQLKEAMKSTY